MSSHAEAIKQLNEHKIPVMMIGGNVVEDTNYYKRGVDNTLIRAYEKTQKALDIKVVDINDIEHLRVLSQSYCYEKVDAGDFSGLESLSHHQAEMLIGMDIIENYNSFVSFLSTAKDVKKQMIEDHPILAPLGFEALSLATYQLTAPVKQLKYASLFLNIGSQYVDSLTSNSHLASPNYLSLIHI